VGEIDFYEKRIVINRIFFWTGFGMNSYFFPHQHRNSIKTLRLQYGLEGMKYIIQIYEGEIHGLGEKEGLPTEYQYEFEQAMLKHVHDLKNEIRENGWFQIET